MTPGRAPLLAGGRLRVGGARRRGWALRCRLSAHRAPVVHGILRPFGGILLELLQCQRYALLELWVVAPPPGGGIELDLDVRGDALVLDVELAAVRFAAPPARRCARPAVEGLGNAAVPNEPAPGARPDKRPDLLASEHPGQRVAARARHFVDEHHLGAKYGLRDDVVAALARHR